MIGFRSSTSSPWRLTSSRRTPWVAGWWGPMFTVSSSCSGSSTSPASVRSIGEAPTTVAEVAAITSPPLAGALSCSCIGHCDHPGTWCSLWVKITGSPPIGKSRRCGQPT